MQHWLNDFTQMLTTASLWVQIPVVLGVLVPLSGVLALVWLRLVDVAGLVAHRAHQRFFAGPGATAPRRIRAGGTANTEGTTQPATQQDG